MVRSVQDLLMTRATQSAAALAHAFGREAQPLACSKVLQPPAVERMASFQAEVQQQLLKKHEQEIEDDGSAEGLLMKPTIGTLLVEAATKHLLCPISAPERMLLRDATLEDRFRQERAALQRDEQCGAEAIKKAESLIRESLQRAATTACDELRNPLRELAMVLRQGGAGPPDVSAAPQAKRQRVVGANDESTATDPTQWTFQGHDWCRKWAGRVKRGSDQTSACCHGPCKFYPCVDRHADSALVAKAAKHFAERR